MLGKFATASAVLGLGLGMATAAFAQETVKIGLIAPFSGPFADAGAQLDAGVRSKVTSRPPWATASARR